MSGNIFYRSNPLLICLVLMAVLVAVVEIGFWTKGRMKTGPNSIEKADIALILGAVLTLLALLLGFTYSMSAGRFEARRQLVVEEANAIGTTYLRAKTLREPRSSEIQELLRRYTALRVEIARGMQDDPEKISEMDNRTKELTGLLWSHGAALARENPTPITSIFLQTLNEMIDLHASRLAAFRNRVPLAIYIVLFVVSVITLWLVGYYFGSHRQRVRVLTTLAALLVTSVMWLVMDLDQPVRGAIRTSQQSLFDLNQDLNQHSPDAATEFHMN
jgi:RsiW-degrading membrane proteinase PrsW (M82 family)